MPTDRELLDQLATEYADYKSRTQSEIQELKNQLKEKTDVTSIPQQERN